MRMVKGLDRKIQTSCGYDEKKVAQYRDGRFNGNSRGLCICCEYYGMKTLLTPTIDTAGSIGGIYLLALKKPITEWTVSYP
jgi:hypothetical protein